MRLCRSPSVSSTEFRFAAQGLSPMPSGETATSVGCLAHLTTSAYLLNTSVPSLSIRVGCSARSRSNHGHGVSMNSGSSNGK